MNVKVTFVLGVCVAAWCLYDLFVSKEAMSTVMVVVEVIAFFGGAATAIGAVVQMQKKASGQT